MKSENKLSVTSAKATRLTIQRRTDTQTASFVFLDRDVIEIEAGNLAEFIGHASCEHFVNTLVKELIKYSTLNYVEREGVKQ